MATFWALADYSMFVHCILGTKRKRKEAGQRCRQMTIGLTWRQLTTWLLARSYIWYLNQRFKALGIFLPVQS